MSFDSFNDFLQMGGHGLYVWLSYGVGLFVIIVAVVSPMRERKRVLRQLAQQLKRQQNIQQGMQGNAPINDTTSTAEDLPPAQAVTKASNNEEAQ